MIVSYIIRHTNRGDGWKKRAMWEYLQKTNIFNGEVASRSLTVEFSPESHGRVGRRILIFPIGKKVTFRRQTRCEFLQGKYSMGNLQIYCIWEIEFLTNWLSEIVNLLD